ncbi:hypothetical protein BKA83DRAFT_4188261 [Pisolithus microcarpus]|nr:hypothetical protein BKA83DRAFT_4188261 [Pisolithus microcarpus]
MDNDYFSIDAILAENQKIQCTFKVDVPEVGHLGGGNDRDASAILFPIRAHSRIKQIKAPAKLPIPMWLAYIILLSEWADLTIPAPFGPRVRNALKADPRSVRLSALVGAGGLWYGFGKMIMDILDDEQANIMSDVLTKAFRGRLTEVIDQAQHFATLGTLGVAGSAVDAAQSFREGLDGTGKRTFAALTRHPVFALAQESSKRTKRWYENHDKARQGTRR